MGSAGSESGSGSQRSSAEEEKNEEEEDEEENGQDSQDDGIVAPTRRHLLSAANAAARSSKSSSMSTLAFPISRVRRLVKSEADVQWVGVEAGFLIAKAAELFLEKFVEGAFDKMTDDERTTLSYKDLASHVNNSERFDFLADFIPETVPASIALSTKMEADR